MSSNSNNDTQEYIGSFLWTLEKSIELANQATKDLGIYYTSIKGTPYFHTTPDQCWAVTNRFDPRVAVRKEKDNARTSTN